MEHAIFEQVKTIIFLAIFGSVVAIIGIYLQSLAIFGLGVIIGSALPVLGLILSAIEEF